MNKLQRDNIEKQLNTECVELVKALYYIGIAGMRLLSILDTKITNVYINNGEHSPKEKASKEMKEFFKSLTTAFYWYDKKFEPDIQKFISDDDGNINVDMYDTTIMTGNTLARFMLYFISRAYNTDTTYKIFDFIQSMKSRGNLSDSEIEKWTTMQP